jgi:hypothetical protein
VPPGDAIEIGFELRSVATGEIIASSRPSAPAAFDAPTCIAGFDSELVTEPFGSAICSLGGTLVEVVGAVADLTGSTLVTGTAQAVLQIDSSLSCGR